MADVLDQEALDDLLAMVGHDPDFVDELVDAYVADAPRQEAAIRAALDAGEAEGVVRPAHNLKGMSLSLGGQRVAEIAGEIEQHGRNGRVEGLDALLADLVAAQRDFETALLLARSRRWAK